MATPIGSPAGASLVLSPHRRSGGRPLFSPDGQLSLRVASAEVDAGLEACCAVIGLSPVTMTVRMPMAERGKRSYVRLDDETFRWMTRQPIAIATPSGVAPPRATAPDRLAKSENVGVGDAGELHDRIDLRSRRTPVSTPDRRFRQ